MNPVENILGKKILVDLGNDYPSYVTIKHKKGKRIIVQDVLGNLYQITIDKIIK